MRHVTILQAGGTMTDRERYDAALQRQHIEREAKARCLSAMAVADYITSRLWRGQITRQEYEVRLRRIAPYLPNAPRNAMDAYQAASSRVLCPSLQAGDQAKQQ